MPAAQTSCSISQRTPDFFEPSLQLFQGAFHQTIMTSGNFSTRRKVISLLKDLVPPIVARGASRLLLSRKGNSVQTKVIEFEHGFDSWQTASGHCNGYDADEIIQRVTNAARLVHAGKAVYERDSVLFDHIEYSWPLLSSILLVAAECRSLRIIDFGGALGTTYYQNRKFLAQLNCPVRWKIVEQEKFVEIGRREFQNEILSFHHSIGDARGERIDAILFGGVIGYIPEPDRILQETIAASPRYIIFDRTSVVESARDVFAVQNVTEPIYNASYPVRIFSKHKLLNSLTDHYALVEEWMCDLQPDANSRQKGFLLHRK
jgi:putative methyltransferase (TIGR04325 family)